LPHIHKIGCALQKSDQKRQSQQTWNEDCRFYRIPANDIHADCSAYTSIKFDNIPESLTRKKLLL
jgi:hypothetical protein